MTLTETTTTDEPTNAELSTPYALHALAAWIIKRRLPSPLSLELPRRDENWLTISVPSFSAPAWFVGGITVDGVGHRPIHGISYQQTGVLRWADCRLTDTGVRVRVQWSVPLTADLSALPKSLLAALAQPREPSVVPGVVGADLRLAEVPC